MMTSWYLEAKAYGRDTLRAEITPETVSRTDYSELLQAWCSHAVHAMAFTFARTRW